MTAALGLTPQEQEIRRQGIGASEIATIAGLNPFASPVDVWLEKTGRAEPFQGNDRTELGHLMEPVIAAWYGRRVGAAEMTKGTTLVHPEVPWMVATPDYFARFADAPTRRVEIKLVGFNVKHHWFAGGVICPPEYVWAQCIWQGLVSGVRECDVAAWFGLGSGEQDMAEAAWDDELAGSLVEIGRDFWFECVQKDVPPTPDATESWARYVEDRFPRNFEPLAEAPESADRWVTQYLAAGSAIAQWEANQREAQTQIKVLIGDREGIERRKEWRATWKADKNGARRFRVTPLGNGLAVIATAPVSPEQLAKIARGGPEAARFWARVEKGSGCWRWTGPVNLKGYGRTQRLFGRQWQAHRLAWILDHGSSPGNRLVLHSCDNPPCCRPSHLFCGSAADNTHDMLSKGRHRPNSSKGSTNPSSKLTEAQVANIRARLAEGARGSKLAREFRVAKTLISQIKNNKIWRHVP